MKPSRGFTLVEVVAELVVFSVGVLMVLGLTGALSVQPTQAARKSEVAVTVQNSLDSLQLAPYDSLAVGARKDTLLLLGEAFVRTRAVLQSTSLVREVQVTVEPADASGLGQTSSAFVLRPW